jgi:hypothetical protein
MTRVLILALALGAFTTRATGQTRPPAPGPEHARLESLTGRWTIDGESQGDRFSRTESCEWFDGKFHVICRSEAAAASGTVKGQSIIGYDAAEKTYTFYFVSSTGTAIFMKGTVSGPVWTWSGELTVAGEPMKARTTITDRSPSEYVFTMEGSFGGGPWMLLEEGRGVKVR